MKNITDLMEFGSPEEGRTIHIAADTLASLLSERAINTGPNNRSFDRVIGQIKNGMMRLGVI